MFNVQTKRIILRRETIFRASQALCDRKG